MVGFNPRAVAEFEGVEDFERAALEAVGLAVEDLVGVVSGMLENIVVGGYR